MENTKKKKTGIIVLVVLLVLAVVGLSGYIVYDKVFANKNDEVNDSGIYCNNCNWPQERYNNRLNKEEYEQVTKEILSLTKEDRIINNEIGKFNEIINGFRDSISNTINNNCDLFEKEYFGLPRNGSEDYLKRISGLLMSCRYGAGYEIKNEASGQSYLMDDDDYADFKKYFAVDLEKDYDFNNKKYYLAYKADNRSNKKYHYYYVKTIKGDYVDVQNSHYPSTVYDFKKVDGKYIVNFDIVDLILDVGYEKIGNAILTLSIKDNHAYYESFVINID